MINDLLQSVDKIYIAYGVTDFRKQISSLCSIVRDTFNMNPYNKSAYIFCNKKRNSIKVLCYDKNGFILAQKTLLETEQMKFQWPRKRWLQKTTAYENIYLLKLKCIKILTSKQNSNRIKEKN